MSHYPYALIALEDDYVQRLAESLRRLALSDGFAATLAPQMRGPREACLRAALWASAICHSTKGGLRGNFCGQMTKGWDYLDPRVCRVLLQQRDHSRSDADSTN